MKIQVTVQIEHNGRSVDFTRTLKYSADRDIGNAHDSAEHLDLMIASSLGFMRAVWAE